MSAVATATAPGPGAATPALGRPRLAGAARHGRGDGEASLEDAVLAAWEGLVVEGSAPCLVCGCSMSAADGCASCGAELS